MTIEVSGGGSLVVTTESLLEADRALRHVAVRAAEASTSAADAIALAGFGEWTASWALRLAQHELGQLATGARRLAIDLRLAAASYGWAERAVLAQQELLARLVGPAVTVPVAVTALAVASAQSGALGVSDPAFVAALRGVADSLSLPLLVAMVQALPGPMLEETAVDAMRVVGASAPAMASAPSGFAALAERIPPAVDGEAQIRVERYVLPSGDTHWMVYVAGTSDWSIVPGANPWDDTSNVVGVAGQSSGSARATVLALEKAGWMPGEPVVPVGHSQGGIVATALATGGIAPVPMLVTFGSPTAGVAVPRGVTNVAVEHHDDPVPTLGGSPGLADARVLVREATPPTHEAGGIAAHSMVGYAHTADEMDRSSDGRLSTARTMLEDFTGGQQAEVSLWLGRRETGVSGPGGG